MGSFCCHTTDSPDLGVQPPSVLFGGTPTTSIPRRHSSITAPGSIANIPPGPAGVWPAKSNTPPLSNEPSVAAPVHQSYPRGPGTREPTYAAPQLHSQQQQITTDQMYPVDEHLSQELRRTSISKSPDRLESTPQVMYTIYFSLSLSWLCMNGLAVIRIVAFLNVYRNSIQYVDATKYSIHYIRTTHNGGSIGNWR